MRTRSFLLAFRLAACLVAAGHRAVLIAQEPQSAPPANRSLLALIARFFEHPTDDRLRSAVLDSAMNRNDVRVELSSTITPWICFGDTSRAIQKMDSVLTVAFIAGNMAAQMGDGRKRDQPTAGVLAVLRVYGQVQRATPGYLVPQVERWRDWEATGKISVLADSLKWAPAQDCPNPKPRRYGGRVRVRSVPDSVPKPPAG